MGTHKRHLRTLLEKTYSVYLLTDSNPTFGDPEAALRLIQAMEDAKSSFLKSLGTISPEDSLQYITTYAFYQGDILDRWTKTNLNP